MENQKKTINRGIQILRMIFSFNIVVFHCIDNKYQNKFIYFICRIAVYYYVPTFFLISFYFSYIILTQYNQLWNDIYFKKYYKIKRKIIKNIDSVFNLALYFLDKIFLY